MAKAKGKAADGTREYGFMLYLQRKTQGEIAERCGVSPQTVTDWKKKDNWEAKRAAREVSVDTLVAKAIMRANELLDDKEFNADAFAKTVKQLKELKTSTTVDDEMMAFMKLQDYIMSHRKELNVSGDTIKEMTRIQDSFITYRIGNAQ